jgi:hypothetical protein
MSEKKPIERMPLPPEAEPARGFIEALVARYESTIAGLRAENALLKRRVAELEEQVRRLTARNSSLRLCVCGVVLGLDARSTKQRADARRSPVCLWRGIGGGCKVHQTAG